MGTHGCIAITYPDGRHVCCERTLDGYFAMDAFYRWMKKGLKPEDYPKPSEIGNGGMEFNGEREHHQEYYYHVDYESGVIYLSHFPLFQEESSLNKLILQLYELINQGWKLDVDYDCEPAWDCHL